MKRLKQRENCCYSPEWHEDVLLKGIRSGFKAQKAGFSGTNDSLTWTWFLRFDILWARPRCLLFHYWMRVVFETHSTLFISKSHVVICFDGRLFGFRKWERYAMLLAWRRYFLKATIPNRLAHYHVLHDAVPFTCGPGFYIEVCCGVTTRSLVVSLHGSKTSTSIHATWNQCGTFSPKYERFYVEVVRRVKIFHKIGLFPRIDNYFNANNLM